MEVIPYYYKNEENPVAFVIKNIFTEITSESYNLYYSKSNYMQEEQILDTLEYNLDDSKTYSSYCDPLGLSMLESLTEKVSKLIGESVLPSYSYTRVYTKGSRLISHKDRESCEMSLTVSLYDSNKGDIKYLHISDKDEKYSSSEDILSVPLSVGDGLLFFGSESAEGYYHWRDTVNNDYILQTFLHYVKAKGKYKDNAYEWVKGHSNE